MIYTNRFYWEAAAEYCLPGSRHHRSWVKVRNLIIVSSGVWRTEAINAGVQGAERGGVMETCFCLFIYATSFGWMVSHSEKSPMGVLEIWIPEESLASWVSSFVQWMVVISSYDLLCGLEGTKYRKAITMWWRNTYHHKAVAEKCSWMW